MAIDSATLDAPFAALAAFDWGGDAKPLAEIDAAVVAAHGDAALTAELERRLAALLGSQASRAAKQYACRKLSLIGTAASVPALAAAKVSGAAAEAVVDGRLACAEALVAVGKKAEAKAIYQAIAAAVGESPATHRDRAVRMACQRGLFAAMGG